MALPQCINRNPLDCVFVPFVWLLLLSAGGWLTLHLFAKAVEQPLDPKEPPLVKSQLPLLGHAIGLYRHGPKYLRRISRKTTSPIYTLNIFSGKCYIVTSPRLISMIGKNSKTINFNPFVAEMGIRATHASEEARKIIEWNVDCSRGRIGYTVEVHDGTAIALGQAHEMQRLSLIVLREAWTRSFKGLEESSPSKLSLHYFLRHMLSVNSTTALYGPDNPLLKDSAIEQAFWDYNADLTLLLIDTQPAIMARKGHIARERLAYAFKKYFDSNPIGKSSRLTECRYSVAKKYGMNNFDIGRLEVGEGIGILVNTVPTLFYMIMHIYKNPKLLLNIREELEQNAIVRTQGSRLVLDLSSIRNQCPLLNSTFQETLRHYSEGPTVRVVCEDTVVDEHLLKKGGVVQMPNSILHRDLDVWRNTDYNPYRFLKQDHKEKKPEAFSTTSAGSYRPFGGGSTICPGRLFAQTEVTGLVAMMVWRFDILPTPGESLVLPSPMQGSVVEAVFPPSHDIEVLLQRRSNLRSSFQEDFDVEFL